MRSLARGLEILDFIARRQGVTFTEIRHATGLSKAVVHRILAELTARGYVWRGLAEPKYFASAHFATTPLGTRQDLLKRAAREPLQQLVGEVRWPSDLFAREGCGMILIDTNCPISPFELKRSRIGRHVPILLSSVGRAALAAMSHEERETVYAELRQRGEWNRQIKRCSSSLDAIIDGVRARGYATREPTFFGEQLERTGIFTIANAITMGPDVVGALNIWWPQSADRQNSFAEKYLPALSRAAVEISGNFSALLLQAGLSDPSGTVQPATPSPGPRHPPRHRSLKRTRTRPITQPNA